jgi:RNA polymerase sigma factor (sigma-70 family)
MSEKRDSHKYALEWFEEFQTLIQHALSSRINRPADIDDLAQEVYLRLLRVPKPELVENPKSYLYRVALNVAEEWRQRAAQRLNHSSEDLSGLVAQENIEVDARRAEREELVKQSLASLSKANRTAIILHIRDGMTYEEVGVHMGVTRRAVKRYIANGYALLRERLGVFGSGDFARSEVLDSGTGKEVR